MNETKLRAAVIGAGMIANAAHIPAWKALGEQVEVAAVADVRAEAAEDTARRNQIPCVYTDPQKMLDEVRPQIVSVCTPNVYHRPWTIAALRAGAHVMCEKPVATTLADAKEMFDVAAAQQKLLYVAQSLRFYRKFATAKELAEGGRLGEPYYASVRLIRRRGVPSWGMFHIKEHNAGGPMFDLGVHAIDLVLWIMGNPRVVAVSGMACTKIANRDEGLLTSVAESGAPVGLFTPRPYDYREFGVEDFAAGLLRLETGAVVQVTACWAANLPDSFEIQIAGTAGGIQLPPARLLTNLGPHQVEVTPKVFADKTEVFPGHYLAAENFLDVIRGRAEPAVKPAEVLNVMRAIEGFYRSAAAGREVWFDEQQETL
jgi:predicted dehydrogenase